MIANFLHPLTARIYPPRNRARAEPRSPFSPSSSECAGACRIKFLSPELSRVLFGLVNLAAEKAVLFFWSSPLEEVKVSLCKQVFFSFSAGDPRRDAKVTMVSDLSGDPAVGSSLSFLLGSLRSALSLKAAFQRNHPKR